MCALPEAAAADANTSVGGASKDRSADVAGGEHWKWPWSMSTKGGASRIAVIAASRSDLSRSEYRLHTAAPTMARGAQTRTNAVRSDLVGADRECASQGCAERHHTAAA
jgi:hypothetical protein